MNEQRLIEIESKLAHQEVLIGELNQVIANQQAAIDEMSNGLKGFFKRFGDINGPEIGPANQKPPHY